jgi:hypothetical protein
MLAPDHDAGEEEVPAFGMQVPHAVVILDERLARQRRPTGVPVRLYSPEKTIANCLKSTGIRSGLMLPFKRSNIS